MVMSIDGRTAIDGRVGALTGPVDQGILRRLRAAADAVLVGASTGRAAGYGSPAGRRGPPSPRGRPPRRRLRPRRPAPPRPPRPAAPAPPRRAGAPAVRPRCP